MGPPRAASADRYLVISTAVRRRVQEVYGIDAEVLPPRPPSVPTIRGATGTASNRASGSASPGSCPTSTSTPWSRRSPPCPAERLIVVGSGPQEAELRARAGANVSMVGRVDDDELAWLYAHCRGVVQASHEDYGLVPLEAATFGRPAVVLEWGGFLDTVVPDATGLFFEEPPPGPIAAAVSRAAAADWDAPAIERHAATFGRDRFIARLQAIDAEERSAG